MSLRTKSGKIPPLPAQIQIKPTHFDVWNDNHLAEQPFRVEPLVRPTPKRPNKVEDQLHSLQNEIHQIRQMLSSRPPDNAIQSTGDVSRSSPSQEEWQL